MSHFKPDYMEKGYPHYLDWFFEIWSQYRRKDAERDREDTDEIEPIRAVLRKAGFPF